MWAGDQAGGKSAGSGQTQVDGKPDAVVEEPLQRRIVIFDGLCNLCSGGAQWLEHHQSTPPFHLVPMQSGLGRTLLARHGHDPDDPLTFLVLDGERCFSQSDAWIHLVTAAGGAWRLAQAARVIPRRLRDVVYRLIARNRYRWFGRRKTCYLAQPSVESDQPSKPPQGERSPNGDRSRI